MERAAACGVKTLRDIPPPYDDAVNDLFHILRDFATNLVQGYTLTLTSLSKLFVIICILFELSEHEHAFVISDEADNLLLTLPVAIAQLAKEAFQLRPYDMRLDHVARSVAAALGEDLDDVLPPPTRLIGTDLLLFGDIVPVGGDDQGQLIVKNIFDESEIEWSPSDIGHRARQRPIIRWTHVLSLLATLSSQELAAAFFASALAPDFDDWLAHHPKSPSLYEPAAGLYDVIRLIHPRISVVLPSLCVVLEGIDPEKAEKLAHLLRTDAIISSLFAAALGHAVRRDFSARGIACPPLASRFISIKMCAPDGLPLFSPRPVRRPSLNDKTHIAIFAIDRTAIGTAMAGHMSVVVLAAVQCRCDLEWRTDAGFMVWFVDSRPFDVVAEYLLRFSGRKCEAEEWGRFVFSMGKAFFQRQGIDVDEEMLTIRAHNDETKCVVVFCWDNALFGKVHEAVESILIELNMAGKNTCTMSILQFLHNNDLNRIVFHKLS